MQPEPWKWRERKMAPDIIGGKINGASRHGQTEVTGPLNRHFLDVASILI